MSAHQPDRAIRGPLGASINQGALWPSLVRFPFDENNDRFWCIPSQCLSEATDGSRIEVEGRPTSWRRGQSVEGGGKRRIFAIGIWVTQRLLAPLLISG